MSNIDKLKPGKYAILFRNNWDGEGDTYETFAILDAEGIWRDEEGGELLEYQGDEVLSAWPMDDGSNVLALLDELEEYKAAYEEESRDKEVQRLVIDDALCKLLPGCQYMDLPDGGSVTPLEQVSRMIADYRERLQAAEKRVAELSHHLECAHAFIEHTEAFGHAASNGILCCGDAQWNIDASKLALAAAGKGE